MFLKKTGENYGKQRKKCTGKQLKWLAIPIYLLLMIEGYVSSQIDFRLSLQNWKRG